MEESLTLELRKPITKGGVEYTTLELREPTAGEMAKARASDPLQDLGMIIHLVSLVAKIPKAVVEEIGVRDLTSAGDYLTSFLDHGPSDGKPSSLT